MSTHQATLSQEIVREYDRLVKIVSSIPKASRLLKIIAWTGGNVSVRDVIAYQIGWGKCLISWYESGLRNDMPQMPGEGFTKWNYTEIALHFYQKYQDDQEKVFKQVVSHILDIVEKEHQSGNLYKLGVWPWCTLQSGKQWSLDKWIKVNTSSPYKRAIQSFTKVFL